MNTKKYRAISPEFIRQIPKTDLHLHLDGSLRIASLIEMAKACSLKLPSYTESGLKELVFKSQYADLREYLKGFAYTCGVLRNAENLERVAYELAEDNWKEGVRYIEVRFAPQLHVDGQLTMEQTVSAVCAGLERAKREFNAQPGVTQRHELPFEYGVIVCAMRAFNAKMGHYYASLHSVMPAAPRRELFAAASLEMARQAVELRDRLGIPLVGFDLAGEEAGYPAIYHVAAYQHAQNHFLKKTVHAGEAYGPESVFQAITACHTNRIGHGTYVFEVDMVQDRSIQNRSDYVEQLVEYIASERITVEVCLTSNFQTSPQIKGPADHPLRHMLDHNLSVSICTDNRLVSNTTVSNELQIVADHMGVTPKEFRNIVAAGFKGSFFPRSYNDKRAYVRQAMSQYDRLAATMVHGVANGEERG